MIITKAPFRISFCGGGSDLEDFYSKHGGCVLSTSINKYCYISIHPYFYGGKTLLKYSETELVESIDDIKHRIFKRVLYDKNIEGVEITSTADIPAGTGLGSSSTFTVALLNALYCYKGKYVSKDELARQACEIEIKQLKNPIGKQDQYAAAYGGFNFIEFKQNGEVSVEPVICKSETYEKLQNNLVMYYTGDVRSANDILSEQKTNMSKSDKVGNLIEMTKLARELRDSVQKNNLGDFGRIMHESWLLKKTLSSGISTSHIDDIYKTAIKNGAVGGKLLGAGGGGFLLFYCDQNRQEGLDASIRLKKMPFRFESSGASVLFVGEKYWN